MCRLPRHSDIYSRLFSFLYHLVAPSIDFILSLFIFFHLIKKTKKKLENCARKRERGWGRVLIGEETISASHHYSLLNYGKQTAGEKSDDQ